MASICRKVRLRLSPSQLWEKVADVGGISQLLDGVQHSSVHGSTRACTLEDGAQLEETILGVDHEQRRVAYTITKAPFPLEFHAASMQVLDEGEEATLVWVADVKPDAMSEPIGQLMGAELARLQARFPAA